jgi:hypothetical protein
MGLILLGARMTDPRAMIMEQASVGGEVLAKSRRQDCVQIVVTADATSEEVFQTRSWGNQYD